MKRVQQQTLFDVIEMPCLADMVELIITRMYFDLQKKDLKKTEKTNNIENPQINCVS